MCHYKNKASVVNDNPEIIFHNDTAIKLIISHDYAPHYYEMLSCKTLS